MTSQFSNHNVYKAGPFIAYNGFSPEILHNIIYLLRRLQQPTKACSHFTPNPTLACKPSTFVRAMPASTNTKVMHGLAAIEECRSQWRDAGANSELQGYVHSLSPVKNARNSRTSYFNCLIQTSTDQKVRAVCFDPPKRVNLQQAFQQKSPVKITGVKRSFNTSFSTDQEEYKIPKQAKIQPATTKFNYTCTRRFVTYGIVALIKFMEWTNGSGFADSSNDEAVSLQSDHKAILFNLLLHTKPKKSARRTVYNYNKGDFAALRESLKLLPLTDIVLYTFIPKRNYKKTVSIEEVLSLLSALSTAKATGPDGISARLLKECADAIAPSLTELFNKSLALVLEHAVHARTLYIVKPLLHYQQHGFRAGRTAFALQNNQYRVKGKSDAWFSPTTPSKYILQDYHSSYTDRLKLLNLLPISY
ncbi:Hypothetical predicted protein, partial [Paramuricea clavata]